MTAQEVYNTRVRTHKFNASRFDEESVVEAMEYYGKLRFNEAIEKAAEEVRKYQEEREYFDLSPTETISIIFNLKIKP